MGAVEEPSRLLEIIGGVPFNGRGIGNGTNEVAEAAEAAATAAAAAAW